MFRLCPAGACHFADESKIFYDKFRLKVKGVSMINEEIDGFSVKVSMI